MESIDSVLIGYNIDDISTEALFLNYATACFLDVDQQDNIYNSLYSFSSDKFDLYGALSSKNAGVKS